MRCSQKLNPLEIPNELRRVNATETCELRSWVVLMLRHLKGDGRSAGLRGG